MGKVEKAMNVVELGLIAFLVYFIVTKAEKYFPELGKAIHKAKREVEKAFENVKKNAEEFARKHDEYRFYKASLPRNVSEQIEYYAEKQGLPEGAKLVMLKQARRYYEMEKKLKGYAYHSYEPLTYIRVKGERRLWRFPD